MGTSSTLLQNDTIGGNWAVYSSAVFIVSYHYLWNYNDLYKNELIHKKYGINT